MHIFILENVNQYLWKMGNIKLWASLGSAI
jgi:hypothetical protein